MGLAVGQLVGALRYKLHSGPGVDPDSNRNEYKKYTMGVKVAGA